MDLLNKKNYIILKFKLKKKKIKIRYYYCYIFFDECFVK